MNIYEQKGMINQGLNDANSLNLMVLEELSEKLTKGFKLANLMIHLLFKESS